MKKRTTLTALRQQLAESTRTIGNLNFLLAKEKETHAETLNTNATLRAMLCQLRVYQTTKHHRTGWAVTAFIPNSVLEGVKDRLKMRETLQDHVIGALVANAFKGIWDVVDGKTKSVCVVYRPLDVTKVDKDGKPLDIKVPTQQHGAPHVILEKDAGDNGDDGDEFEAYNPNKPSTWRKT